MAFLNVENGLSVIPKSIEQEINLGLPEPRLAIEGLSMDYLAIPNINSGRHDAPCLALWETMVARGAIGT
ncbi:hypothetical protein HPP92_002376 [Vanilla planifolia]|uniref:Uncharacterized protein n=1 Tax=Vanilla planifolia TaxID=51239 RepID=A0A835S6A1_VANPL|nr:hypothetical protein HPP92_002376 [Vanilla planifolia]